MKLTYVYETTEVILTGRMASKLENSNSNKRRLNSSHKTQIKYEITPIADSGASWKKWVFMGELYIIEDINNV
jgi:hypothetical protein